jgi:hypothetical protein
MDLLRLAREAARTAQSAGEVSAAVAIGRRRQPVRRVVTSRQQVVQRDGRTLVDRRTRTEDRSAGAA